MGSSTGPWRSWVGSCSTSAAGRERGVGRAARGGARKPKARGTGPPSRLDIRRVQHGQEVAEASESPEAALLWRGALKGLDACRNRNVKRAPADLDDGQHVRA